MKLKSLFRRRPQPLRQPDIYEAAELNAERYGLEVEVRFKIKRK
jgi:hypothetical protein